MDSYKAFLSGPYQGSVMVVEQTQKLLAVAMIVLGLFQAATAFTQDSLSWSLFYVLFGGSFAIIGLISL